MAAFCNSLAMSQAHKGSGRKNATGYPLETEGSRVAAKARAACNKLSRAEQRRLLEHGIARIYAKLKRT